MLAFFTFFGGGGGAAPSARTIGHVGDGGGLGGVLRDVDGDFRRRHFNGGTFELGRRRRRRRVLLLHLFDDLGLDRRRDDLDDALCKTGREGVCKKNVNADDDCEYECASGEEACVVCVGCHWSHLPDAPAAATCRAGAIVT